jgi:hypothetical protein
VRSSHGIALAALLAFTCLPATAHAVTLITPQGKPDVRMQRWAAASDEPTGHAPITVMSIRSLCWSPGNPPTASCRSAGAPYELAASDRDSFYFELGGIFDDTTLKGWQRAHLARLWGHPHARWWDSPNVVAEGSEDGLEADFAAVYAQCAEGHWKNQGAVVGLAPPVIFGASCCRYIHSA